MIFCMKININVFYKLALSFLQVIIRLAESCENSKCNIFALSQKERRDEFDFLNADRQTILQVDTIKLGGHGQAPPPPKKKKITQNSKFGKSLLYLKKEVGHKVDFLCR